MQVPPRNIESKILYHYKYLLLSTASPEKYVRQIETYFSMILTSKAKFNLCKHTEFSNRTTCFNKPFTEGSHENHANILSVFNLQLVQALCKYLLGKKLELGPVIFKQTSRIHKNQNQNKLQNTDWCRTSCASWYSKDPIKYSISAFPTGAGCCLWA